MKSRESAMAPMRPRAAGADGPLLLMVGEGGAERRPLQRLFEDGGFPVREARDCAAAEAVLAREPIELIILEGRIGDGGALAVCTRLARTSVAPVVILSDVLDPTERVIALEVGADEYMSHPVERRELIARARALVRRSRRVRQSEAPATQPWTLDESGRRFSGPDGRWVALTPGEIALLSLFLRHPGRPITAATAARLLNAPQAWTVESFRTLIVRLRRRLVDSGCHETVIRTVYGSGYVFEGALTELRAGDGA
jgi:DNA-binding response OmpR family regulator